MNDYEIFGAETVRRLAPGCTVLLRSNGAFPLDAPCPIALYGSGARRTVKGGTGSGEVNSRSSLSVEQGLQQAGFTVTTGFWLDSYDGVVAGAKKDFLASLRKKAKEQHTQAAVSFMGAVMPEPEYNIPLRGHGDVAVYVLSRIAGEGSDRQAVPGDILLTETEVRDILALREQYAKFLLVLNVGGVVDLSPLGAVENILLLSQLGAETGGVLADLLLGKAYPSGKLAATWAAWEDYAGPGDFGGRDNTRYREGVYVGYRWFDTVEKAPLFPFGFGLSYTRFALKNGSVTVEGENVSAAVTVENIGDRPGREVVQAYVSCPAGKLDKPYQVLAAFRKSRELQPGDKEELTLSFSLRDLASFDESRHAWLLEKGDYVLRIGADSRATTVAAKLRLDGEAVAGQVLPCFGKPGFRDWQPEQKKRPAPRSGKVIPVSAAAIPPIYPNERSWPIESAVRALSDEELARLNVGAYDPMGMAGDIIGSAGKTVAGAAGQTADSVPGFPSLVMADGPAGLRLSPEYILNETGAHSLGPSVPESVRELLPPVATGLLALLKKQPQGELKEQYCTAIPIGSAIAQSWDPDLAEACGDLVGSEMERFGVHLWLAPALNIQRDIRCGRNFEYFSEDPLLTGAFAAALTRGVQKHPGRGVTIKHFAANNQETNRYNSNSRVSERAMREIYLRGFGIAVRQAAPKAVMTSYNLINGTHSSERRDLLEDVLRGEFGFDGIVMTDWIIMGGTVDKKSAFPGPRADRIAAAGNDLTMPGGAADVKAILKGLREGTVTREQLEINASRLLRLIRDLMI